MKKFNFTLQSLKKYDDQVLDSEKSILGRLRAELAEMQSELDAKVAEYEQSIDKLNELEQNAQELKELLKTAELAGYLQGGTMQFYTDVMQTDNSELMQIMTGLEISSPIGDVLSEEGAFSGLSDGNDVNMALGLQNGEISAVNDFASEIQMNNGDSADTVKRTNVKAEIASDSIAGENAVAATADKSDAFASVAVGNAEKSSDADNIRSEADMISTDKTDNIGSRETAVIKADGVKADSSEVVKAEFTVTSYEKYGDNSVKQNMQTQDDSTQRMAFAKRNIESKSDELRAIAKGNVVTKSDSDLDAEQKVTDKNAVSDMLAKGSDVFARTESRYDENGQEVRTLRVPISDMAEFVSEHAPKANGRSTLTVVLTPETLGKITVRMANEGGKLTVEILTETQAAKELLQAKSQQLAYALKNDDVELTSYKVETSQAELFQRDFDGSSKNPYRQQSHGQQKNDTDDFEELLGEIQTMD